MSSNVMRANIYQLAGTESAPIGHIREGLDIVGQFVGGISVNRICNVRLATEGGEVAGERIGFRNLDTMVDLHVFTIPMTERRSGALGLSFMGHGIAIVDSRSSRTTTTMTTAHEVAHSLGFVDADAPQKDKVSPCHCGDTGCIMRAQEGIPPELAEMLTMTNGMDRLFGRARMPGSMMGGLFGDLKVITDFCLPCKADMRDLAEEKLAAMRTRRLSVGFPVRRILRER
jgi:hypothetical protein